MAACPSTKPECGESFMAGTICSDAPNHNGEHSCVCQECGGDWMQGTCAAQVHQFAVGDRVVVNGDDADWQHELDPGHEGTIKLLWTENDGEARYGSPVIGYAIVVSCHDDCEHHGQRRDVAQMDLSLVPQVTPEEEAAAIASILRVGR